MLFPSGRRAFLLALLTVAALSVAVLACDKSADLAPIKDGVAKSAALVCAPAPARPAHGTKVRDVSSAEVTTMLVALCSSQAADAGAPANELGALHDALLDDHAVVGEARRSDLLINGGNTNGCVASFTSLDRVFLGAATKAAQAGRYDEALARCADVIAIARDEDLTGALTELLFANSEIQHAVETCLPFVSAAPRAAVTPFAAALKILRPTFPTSLDAALERDHAEVTLLRFGNVRNQDTALPCSRATRLAAADASPKDSEKLLTLWRAMQAKTPPEELAKYQQAYETTLGALDRLVSLADVGASK